METRKVVGRLENRELEMGMAGSADLGFVDGARHWKSSTRPGTRSWDETHERSYSSSEEGVNPFGLRYPSMQQQALEGVKGSPRRDGEGKVVGVGSIIVTVARHLPSSGCNSPQTARAYRAKRRRGSGAGYSVFAGSQPGSSGVAAGPTHGPPTRRA